MRYKNFFRFTVLTLALSCCINSTIYINANATVNKIHNYKSEYDNKERSNKNGWEEISGNWYYYKDNKLATGWQKVKDKWYLLDNTNGHMLTGWQKVRDKWYLLDKINGDMLTDWQKVNGKWYLMDNISGHMLTGWQKVKDTWYLLDKINGDMLTDWQKVNGKWYLMDNISGHMLIGWQKVRDKWYLLDKINGDMLTGWQEINNKLYYMYPNSGVMASNTIIDSRYLSSDGSYDPDSSKNTVVEYAKTLLGKPYEWGATGPDSFDCSGFTQYVYENSVNVDITRTTYSQIEQGIPVSIDKLLPGDLVFLNEGHVGIYIGNGEYIHSPQSNDVVKISKLTHLFEGRRILQ